MATLFDILRDPESLTARDLATLAHFGIRSALVPLGAARSTGPLSGRAVARLKRAGIDPWLAFAPAEQRLPGGGLEIELQQLPSLLSLPRAVALGPIGLGPVGPPEEYALARVLALAERLRRPVVVQASRDRRRIRRLLGVLRESKLPPERALLIGLPSAALKLVREIGHSIGLGLSLDLPAERLVEVVSHFGSERVLLLGSGGDMLSLPKAASVLAEARIPGLVIQRIAHENARRLFGGEPL